MSSHKLATARKNNFRHAKHTLIMSDIHLSDAEPAHPSKPLWKRYKRRRYFIDRTFKTFLDDFEKKVRDDETSRGESTSPLTPIELILNGDIFDFDSVLAIPEHKSFKVNWLEKRRGLSAEEDKSSFKMELILSDHRIWVNTIRDFILRGNRVVFIIGNHDMELHWPKTQEVLVRALQLPAEFHDSIRFCEWFFISNQDTLIEHGNQYDAYCLCSNPLHPLIKKGSHILVRQPFGNLANKYMLNGMGLFNPHVESNFIMSAKEYLVFFFKYMIRTQPFLIWTWLWGAMVTLITSVTEGLLPSMKDPLMVELRISEIAAKSNSSPRVVRALRELHIHPAIYNPLMILRELWLDRAFLFIFICLASVQIFSFINVFTRVSAWWSLVPLLFFMPFFIFYAQRVKSDVMGVQEALSHYAPMAAKIARVKRVVHGHTHREEHLEISGVEVINTGTWSPAYLDPECRKPYGKKPFAWIRPGRLAGEPRRIELYEWREGEGAVLIPSGAHIPRDEIPKEIPEATPSAKSA